MTKTLTLEVSTHVFGLGNTRTTDAVYLVLPRRETTARTLIAEHIRAEVERANATRTASLALHYLLVDDLHHIPAPRSPPTLDAAFETSHAYAALASAATCW